jgi:hypothetical protein
MSKPTQVIYSYTGRLVGPNNDTPSLQDISVALGRIARYAGASVKFWPVLLHSMVVADLLPGDLKIYGLLHDSTESIVGDIPRGFKPEWVSQIEHKMLGRILTDLGIPSLSQSEYVVVKAADDRALFGEVWTVGTFGLQGYYPTRDAEAENLVLRYAKEFPPEECIRPDGLAVLEFNARFRDYRAMRKRV